MSDANDVLKRLLGMLNEATATASSSSTSGGPPAKKPKYTAEERREHAKKLQREVAENASKNVAAEVRQELQTLKEAIRMLAQKTEELSDAIKTPDSSATATTRTTTPRTTTKAPYANLSCDSAIYMR